MGEVEQCSAYMRIAEDKSNSDEIRAKALDSHPNCLSNIGWNVSSHPIDSKRVLASADANRKLSISSKALNPVSQLQFFPKERDENSPYNRAVVISYLQNLGFKVEVERPQITNISTNAVFYSHDVPSEDIKAVAYALIRAGASIKAIHPSTRTYGQSKLIQVGADAAYDARPPLTIDQISNANFEEGKRVTLPAAS